LWAYNASYDWAESQSWYSLDLGAGLPIDFGNRDFSVSERKGRSNSSRQGREREEIMFAAAGAPWTFPEIIIAIVLLIAIWAFVRWLKN
jgi:hypothetical protein